MDELIVESYKDKLIRIFYKYYNSDTENANSLAIFQHLKDVSELSIWIEFESIEELQSEWI